MKIGLPYAAVALCAVITSGCASIVSGRHADVTIDSLPTQAHVVIRDKRGREVANTMTPATVTLKRKDKWIFPARYTATLSAPGHEPIDVPIHSTVNPWVLGNVIIGGIPGIIIDSATGAVWTPSDGEIRKRLAPATPSISQPSSLPTSEPQDIEIPGPSA